MERVKSLITKYTPYVEDIRQRLFLTAIIFVSFFIVGFFGTSVILKFILSFFRITNVVIATTSPFQFADLSIDIGLCTAFLVTGPFLLYQIVMFLKPALTVGEKRTLALVIPVTLILFVVGFIYGFLIMYYALIILAGINTSLGIQNIWDIGMFLSQIVITSTLLGVLFQFPMVCTCIIRMGFLDVDLLRTKRRLAIVIIFIFTSLLPPTDGLSLLAMALPLVVLYEATIFINSRSRKRISV